METGHSGEPEIRAVKYFELKKVIVEVLMAVVVVVTMYLRRRTVSPPDTVQ